MFFRFRICVRPSDFIYDPVVLRIKEVNASTKNIKNIKKRKRKNKIKKERKKARKEEVMYVDIII